MTASDLDYLIDSRRQTLLMWRAVVSRRKPHSRGWWRAQAHVYSADMLLGFAYRMTFERSQTPQT
jgi:hypothetical protein